MLNLHRQILRICLDALLATIIILKVLKGRYQMTLLYRVGIQIFGLMVMMM